MLQDTVLLLILKEAPKSTDTTVPSVHETFHAFTADADALYRHWKRVCWVLDMWSQADIG